jgi:malate synthase
VADLAPRTQPCWPSDRLQTELDTWHKANPGPITDMAAYRKFLTTIGYLVESPKDAKATTENVDAELAIQAGPQLVVPILNARYALNAANARWGSLYDALYGTDAISEEGGAEKGKGYNPCAAPRSSVRTQLPRSGRAAGLGSHKDSTGYAVEGGKLVVPEGRQQDRPEGRSQVHRLPGRCRGSQIGAAQEQRPAHRHHRQQVHPHRQHRRRRRGRRGGRSRPVHHSGLEDSVAAVDAEDKWATQLAGHSEGTLTESFEKGGKTLTRGLNPDREYTGADGKP